MVKRLVGNIGDIFWQMSLKHLKRQQLFFTMSSLYSGYCCFRFPVTVWAEACCFDLIPVCLNASFCECVTRRDLYTPLSIFLASICTLCHSCQNLERISGVFYFLKCNVVSMKVECDLYRSPFHKTILFTFYFSQSPVNAKMSCFFPQCKWN